MTTAKELAERLEAEAVVIQQEIATGRREPRATMIEAAARLRQMDKALGMFISYDKMANGHHRGMAEMVQYTASIAAARKARGE